MIEKAANLLASFFYEKKIYQLEDIPEYVYGFEVLLSTVVNLFFIICLSIVTNTESGAIMFCIAFIPLRMTAGGYHATHHWSCILTFLLTYLAFVVIVHCLDAKEAIYYSFASIIISCILVWFLAPVEAENKTLENKHKQLQRKKSEHYCIFNLILLSIVLLIDSQHMLIMHFNYYASGALAASCSLVAAKLLT